MVYKLILMLFIISGCSNFKKTETTDSEITSQESINIAETDVLKPSDPILPKVAEEVSNQIPKQKTHTDLWVMIQDKLILDRNINRKKVSDKIAWFARNQEYVNRVVKRAEPYLFHIITKLEERNMPIDLALLPIVESAYQPFAYSPSRASGIWQFIPATGKRYGLKQNWWYDGRRDIIASSNAAMDYLGST